MTLDSRVVNSFRTRIAKRYFLWCGIAAGLAVACVLVLCIDCFNAFINIMLSCLAAFATWLAVSLWVHHRKMLKKLIQADPVTAFDEYVSKKLKGWENDALMRILIGAVFTILSILFIFYQSEKHWFAISASLLIAFVLFTMLKSWSYYLDGLLLHDVRRSTRDQEDIST